MNSSGIADQFVGILESETDPGIIEKEFSQLTKALTVKAFEQIKSLEQEKPVAVDQTKKSMIDREIDRIKENLVKSVVRIAVLSDNYKNEE